MTQDLAPRDRELLTAIVDEQLSPMRKTGIALMVLSLLALAFAGLEWNDARHRHTDGFYLPSTAWLGLCAFAVLGIGGALLFRASRSVTEHALYRALVEGRHEVTRIEVIRVINSSFDCIVVYTPRYPTPIRMVVKQQDRDAIAALLARACPHVRSAGG
jgi:hypothetical protein